MCFHSDTSTKPFNRTDMKKYLWIFFTALFFSCEEEDIPTLSESFFKIYDHANYDLAFNPIDVAQTVDGYLILTGTELDKTDFNGVRIIKVDTTGEYVDQLTLQNYVIPVGEMFLNEADSNCYFFAANPITLQAVLLGVTPQLELAVERPINGLNYPLASNITFSGNLLLLSYDPVNLNTQISEIGTDGSLLATSSYSIGPGDDVLEEIIDHYLNASERPLPFFCGEHAFGSYYFNGYYNYNLSLVFTNLSGGATGVVQGQGSEAGFRSVFARVDDGTFAVSGYQFSDNYQLSEVSLSTGGLSSIADIYTGDMAELRPYTPSKIVSYEQGIEYIVFAAESESRQIVLNFYEASSGQVAGTYRIGYANPYTFASLKVGSDNSLIVLGTTFVAGRFERIVLNKISSSEIAGILNP